MPDCAVPNCASNAKTGQLMCLKHWRLVLRPTQRRVNDTWRNVKHDANAYRAARADAIAEAIAAASTGEQADLL